MTTTATNTDETLRLIEETEQELASLVPGEFNKREIDVRQDKLRGLYASLDRAAREEASLTADETMAARLAQIDREKKEAEERAEQDAWEALPAKERLRLRKEDLRNLADTVKFPENARRRTELLAEVADLEQLAALEAAAATRRVEHVRSSPGQLAREEVVKLEAQRPGLAVLVVDGDHDALVELDALDARLVKLKRIVEIDELAARVKRDDSSAPILIAAREHEGGTPFGLLRAERDLLIFASAALDKADREDTVEAGNEWAIHRTNIRVRLEALNQLIDAYTYTFDKVKESTK